MQYRLGLRRFLSMRSGVLGLVVVGTFTLLAVIAPWISPWPPNTQDLMNTLAPPSGEHLLGTDQLGRDLLSRIIFGARTSMGLGVVVVGIGLLAGTALGLTAGLAGRAVDAVVMRSVDMLMAFPSILLALAIVSALGPGLLNAMIAIGIAATPRFVRIMRASVLGVKPREFVEAARAVGASELRVALVHVLPNALAPVTVFATLLMAEAVLTAAGLGFLGIGVQPPTAEWGAMLSEGRTYLRTAPHVVTLPGVAIMLMVLGFNLLGDGLRDALDVRLSD
ncbi:MAG: ABC transporter permease [Armatimonadota bacterium]|nr:ABC transporter permease [Armatimonadota bacterium]